MKMNRISSVLLQSDITKIREEFCRLERELTFREIPQCFTAEAAKELKREIRDGREQTEHLKISLRLLEANSTLIPKQLYQNFRRLKLELHYADRKYKRLLSNEERIKKIKQRRHADVSTFAA